MVQLTVKLVGFALALPLALSAVGGWARVRAMQPTPDYWNLWQGGQSGLIYLAMLGPAFVVSPGLLQKIYGARDDRAVRLGVGANALGLALYAMVPVVDGDDRAAAVPGSRRAAGSRCRRCCCTASRRWSAASGWRRCSPRS